jgi:hypothetical protein
MSSYQVLIFLGISLKLDNFKILKKCIFVKFNFFKKLLIFDFLNK